MSTINKQPVLSGSENHSSESESGHKNRTNGRRPPTAGSSKTPQNHKKGKTCYLCHKPGHIAKQCRKVPSGKAKGTRQGKDLNLVEQSLQRDIEELQGIEDTKLEAEVELQEDQKQRIKELEEYRTELIKKQIQKDHQEREQRKGLLEAIEVSEALDTVNRSAQFYHDRELLRGEVALKPKYNLCLAILFFILSLIFLILTYDVWPTPRQLNSPLVNPDCLRDPLAFIGYHFDYETIEQIRKNGQQPETFCTNPNVFKTDHVRLYDAPYAFSTLAAINIILMIFILISFRMEYYYFYGFNSGKYTWLFNYVFFYLNKLPLVGRIFRRERRKLRLITTYKLLEETGFDDAYVYDARTDDEQRVDLKHSRPLIVRVLIQHYQILLKEDKQLVQINNIERNLFTDEEVIDRFLIQQREVLISFELFSQLRKHSNININAPEEDMLYKLNQHASFIKSINRLRHTTDSITQDTVLFTMAFAKSVRAEMKDSQSFPFAQ